MNNRQIEQYKLSKQYDQTEQGKIKSKKTIFCREKNSVLPSQYSSKFS